MNNAIKKVAVIGVGSMGKPMARHLLQAGFELTLCDRTLASMEEFIALGATTTVKPSDCSGCDAVIVLVATPEQVAQVTTGANGLRDIQPGIDAMFGGPRYVVVMSTVAPDDMRGIAAAFADMTTKVVDAPVSGGVVGARKGTLTILAGGAVEDVAALRPLFEAVGEKIVYCGPIGAGQATKVINNIVAISNLMISAEAYAIAFANGLELEKFIPALEAGSARNFMTGSAGDPPEIYAAWSGSVADYTAVQVINGKDIDLALSLCPPGMSLPAITALRQLIGNAGKETLANWRAIARKASPQVA